MNMPQSQTPVVPTCRVDLAGYERPATEKEWLLTNGLGGFAMGSISGCNSRRYHSTLIAARRPPVDRFNTVNLVGEQLIFDGQTHELFSMQFTGEDGPVFHPQGWKYLARFERDTACRWVYHIGPLRLIKQLRLVWKRQIAMLSYRLGARPDASAPLPDRVTLRLVPFVSLRDFHGTRGDADPRHFSLHTEERHLIIGADDAPPIYMEANAGAFQAQPDCWDNVHYAVEAARGLDAVEQLYTPGYFEHTVNDPAGQHDIAPTLRLMIAAEPIDWAAADGDDGRAAMLNEQVTFVQSNAGKTKQPDALAALVAAAADFVVDRTVDEQRLSTILAGYPWFSDWGRDTFISLPGLLLCTGRFDEARRVLCTYARHIRNALIPNRFDDYGGEPHYNTVDASLWFVHAAMQYLKTTDDHATWSEVLESACLSILTGYRDGVPNDVSMDRDGLIVAGNPHTQLTWMDAKRDGMVFTPRHGKAVEINALWHHGLVGFTEATGNRHVELAALIDPVRRAFNNLFWDDTSGGLIDHVNEHGPDRSIRPNQVFAVSLEHSPLSQARQRSVMKLVTEKLLTPRGLRTLPTDEPHYHGRCIGTMYERDSAYHRGTVWAWLIGPYVEGLLRSRKFSAAARKQASKAVEPLRQAVIADSLGQLHEIFDGDPPHHPRGCIAQAWSIAELLRAVVLIEQK